MSGATAFDLLYSIKPLFVKTNSRILKRDSNDRYLNTFDKQKF